MRVSRRNLLKGLTLGSGAMLLPPMAQRILANTEGKTSAPRFVFVVQSNGFDAVQACPESIPFQKYEDRDKFETFDLAEHKLPKGLAPLEELKSKKKHAYRVLDEAHDKLLALDEVQGDLIKAVNETEDKLMEIEMLL